MEVAVVDVVKVKQESGEESSSGGNERKKARTEAQSRIKIKMEVTNEDPPEFEVESNPEDDGSVVVKSEIIMEEEDQLSMKMEEEDESESHLELDEEVDTTSTSYNFQNPTETGKKKWNEGKRKQHLLEQFEYPWDPNFAPMPFSPQNERVVQVMKPATTVSAKNGVTDEPEAKWIKTEERVKVWDLIERTLATRICSCDELNDKINTIADTSTYFNVLKHTIEEDMTCDEGYRFFDEVLPFMVKLCLDLPNLPWTRGIPLMKPSRFADLNLTHGKIASLMANAFFCTFPPRLETDENYSPINFNELYSCTPSDECMQVMVQRLRFILHYFERLATAKGRFKFTPVGRTLRSQSKVFFIRKQKALSNRALSKSMLEIEIEGAKESHGVELLPKNSSGLNKFDCGCGEPRAGRIDEEILFLVYPELIVSRLFMERLLPGEGLVVRGCERFSNAAAGRLPYTFAGSFQKCPNLSWSHREQTRAEIVLLGGSISCEGKSGYRTGLGFEGRAFIRFGENANFPTSSPPKSTSAEANHDNAKVFPCQVSTDDIVKERKPGEIAKAASVVFPNNSSCHVPIRGNGKGMQVCQVSAPDTTKKKPGKIALLLSYCNGNGEELSLHEPRALEQEIQETLVECKFRNSNVKGKMGRVSMGANSEETGHVSAARRVVTFLEPPNFELDLLNEHLPSHIRALGFKRATRLFDAGISLGSLTYTYMLPTFVFAPVEVKVTEDYRITPEVLAKVRKLFQTYVGEYKGLQNFTTRPSNDGIGRKVVSFDCSDPFVREELEYVQLQVRGRYFLPRQVEKMIGLGIAILRGFTSDSILEKAFGNERFNIPQVPSAGLILENLHYGKYDMLHGGECIHEPMTWDEFKPQVEEFCNTHIYPRITKIEREKGENSMWTWLETVAHHVYEVKEGDRSDRAREIAPNFSDKVCHKGLSHHSRSFTFTRCPENAKKRTWRAYKCDICNLLTKTEALWIAHKCRRSTIKFRSDSGSKADSPLL